MKLRRRAVLAAALACGGVARAQPLPYRIVCVSPPGGAPDIVARAYAQQLGPATLVDDRPGAGGLIAVGALQHAHADGTTLLLGHSGLVTTNPFVYRRLPYDPDGDLLPVSLAAELTIGLAVGPSIPPEVRSVGDLVAWARARRGGISYGTPGVATLPHLLGAAFAHDAGFDGRHVPYSGSPPAIAELAGGLLDAVVLPEGLLRPFHLAGRLRLLAIFDRQRSTELPAVPTIAESGFELPTGREWFAFFAPRGTPRGRADDAAQALNVALAPAVVAVLAEAGLRAVTSTSAQLAERVVHERLGWRDLVAASGIRLP